MLTLLDDFLFCLPWPYPLILIILTMSVVGLVALRLKQLSLSGALAAIIEGVVVLWCLRFEGFFLFFLFYFTCIVFERYTRNLTGKKIKKHEARESLAVLANGAMASIAAMHFYNTGYHGALVMFGAAIAEATSDTWAGEIGRLSKKPPVSIKTFREVKKGLSGGVTALGFIAAFAAVLFIGLVWMFCFPIKHRGIAFTIVCFSGFAGCILDSFLGATCQALYEDENGELTETETEKLVRGVAWMDNDAVNFTSNFFSAVFALALSTILF